MKFKEIENVNEWSVGFTYYTRAGYRSYIKQHKKIIAAIKHNVKLAKLILDKKVVYDYGTNQWIKKWIRI